AGDDSGRRPLAFARPGGAVAPLHADARASPRTAAGADRARRRGLAGGPRRPPLPRCRLELVDQPVRACRTTDRRGDRRAGKRTRTGDPGRLLARTRGGACRTTAGDRAPRTGPPAAVQGVLRGQWLGRGRGRAEDGLPLVPEPWRGPEDQVHRAGKRLPRRNPGGVVGGRRAAV